MDRPPPRRRIRISPSVSQFPATKKAVEKSYADLETAYQRVRIAQLTLKYRSLQHLGLEAFRLLPVFSPPSSTSGTTALESATLSLERAKTTFTARLTAYTATWHAHLATHLLTLPLELRDQIFAHLPLTRHPFSLTSTSSTTNTSSLPSSMDLHDPTTFPTTFLPSSLLLLGPTLYTELQNALLHTTPFTLPVWLTLSSWGPSTLALHGPENLPDVVRRIERGVARLYSLLDPGVLRAARAARPRSLRVRIAARVCEGDVGVLVEGLAGVVSGWAGCWVGCVVVLYVGAGIRVWKGEGKEEGGGLVEVEGEGESEEVRFESG